MYRLDKGKIASCLGLFVNRQGGVSNNFSLHAVCCFQKTGGILWTQQLKRKTKKRRINSANWNTIPFPRPLAKDAWWAGKPIMSAVILRAERTFMKQLSGLPLGRLTTKMRGEAV